MKKGEEGKKNNIVRTTLISSGIWGILAHGMTLFNKFSFHDDAPLFLIGGTYTVGRWMLGLLGEWMVKLTGSFYCSTPLFKGTLTILFIALICILILMLLDIDDFLWNIALSGIMVTFPVITGVLGYGFTAPYYLFGTLLGVFGIFCVCRYRKWYFWLAGVLLAAAGIGVYQANIPVCISLLLLHMIKVVSKENRNWKRYFLLALHHISVCAGFMTVYIGMNGLMLRVKKLELSGYSGINDFGKTSRGGYWNRCVLAYREFFDPAEKVSYNMYPFSLNKLYKFFLVICILMTAYMLFKKFQEGISKGVRMSILVCMIPLSVNFIFVICDMSAIHTLMMYGEIFFFVYIAGILNDIKLKNEKLQHRITMTLAGLLIFMAVIYSRFDNICYLKAEVLQSRAISYYTALIAQIKGTEGYRDDLPVVYINEFHKSDQTLPDIPQFDEIRIYPYHFSELINNYTWKTTMKLWCGFSPIMKDAAEYEQLPEVEEMPGYPDAGSIKIVEDVLVIKF